MAAEAEAAREARAKVIAAEGEQKASRALKVKFLYFLKKVKIWYFFEQF